MSVAAERLAGAQDWAVADSLLPDFRSGEAGLPGASLSFPPALSPRTGCGIGDIVRLFFRRRNLPHFGAVLECRPRGFERRFKRVRLNRACRESDRTEHTL